MPMLLYGFDFFDENKDLNDRFEYITFPKIDGVTFKPGQLNQGKSIEFTDGASLIFSTGEIKNSHNISFGFALKVKNSSLDSEILNIIYNDKIVRLSLLNNRLSLINHNDIIHHGTMMFDNMWCYIEIRFNVGPYPIENGIKLYCNGVEYVKITSDNTQNLTYKLSLSLGDINHNNYISIDDMYINTDSSNFDVLSSAKISKIDIDTVENTDNTIVNNSNSIINALSDNTDTSYVTFNPQSKTVIINFQKKLNTTYGIALSFSDRTINQSSYNIMMQGNNNYNTYTIFSLNYTPYAHFEKNTPILQNLGSISNITNFVKNGLKLQIRY
ncbi:hypothetical protein [Photobacterium damselae]|uniref:hypothetical protein n=1 Tax=Photobacterium damselae TaxID=38293 RepID=UPI002F412FBA